MDAASISLTARLVLLDLEAPAWPGADLDSLRALLSEARRARISIVHGYRTSQGAGRRTPLEGLSPLPNEPVFLRTESCAFSSRAFGVWVGGAPAPLILVGGPEAVRQSARTATAIGHRVYLLMKPANAEESDPYSRQLHPYFPSRFFAPAEMRLDRISDAARGAANGQG